VVLVDDRSTSRRNLVMGRPAPRGCRQSSRLSETRCLASAPAACSAAIAGVERVPPRRCWRWCGSSGFV